jgi:hypothetical protein
MMSLKSIRTCKFLLVKRCKISERCESLDPLKSLCTVLERCVVVDASGLVRNVPVLSRKYCRYEALQSLSLERDENRACVFLVPGKTL